MTAKFALTALFGLLLGVAALGAPTHANAATVIESQTVVNGYPQTLTFKVTARADTDITDVTLAYAITGRGTSAIDKPKELTPARNLSAEVSLQVNSGSNYIPVGSDFTFHWEITTADGQTFVGPDEKFFYLPPGKDWQTVSNDFMTVYYHGDRLNLANAYLKSGEDTYERIGKQLYNITLRQLPVKVIMFADEAESDLARPGSGGRFDAAVTTCGTKVTNDIVMVIPVACGSPDRTDTLRHEFGHILNETAGEGSIGKLPSWLDEGAAVYAQSSPGDYEASFLAAARADRLIPFAQMGTPATDARQVGVFYGQSWAMVTYLIEKEGPQTFGRFMATIKGGQRFDAALSSVYGFADLADFENEFRGALNLTPAQQPTAAPTQRPQQAQPTTAPTRAPAQNQQGGNNDDGDGIGTGTIIIGGVAGLFVLAAIFAFLMMMMMQNNRTNAVVRAAPAPAVRRPIGAPADWRPPEANPPSTGSDLGLFEDRPDAPETDQAPGKNQD